MHHLGGIGLQRLSLGSRTGRTSRPPADSSPDLFPCSERHTKNPFLPLPRGQVELRPPRAEAPRVLGERKCFNVLSSSQLFGRDAAAPRGSPSCTSPAAPSPLKKGLETAELTTSFRRLAEVVAQGLEAASPLIFNRKSLSRGRKFQSFPGISDPSERCLHSGAAEAQHDAVARVLSTRIAGIEGPLQAKP